jgi:hypothetical protein
MTIAYPAAPTIGLGQDLSGADLIDAHLTHANVIDADLSGANLICADLLVEPAQREPGLGHLE